MASNDLKSRIRSAASEKMYRYGIKRLSMDDLASELGISKKTIYLHYKSKSELVEDAFEDFMREIGKEQDHLLDLAATPLDKINALLTPVYRLLLKVDKIFLDEITRAHPGLWDKVERYRSKRLEVLKEIIHEGIWDGLFKPVDPDLAANLLTVTVTNFITPDNLKRINVPPSEALKFVISTYLMGLVSEGYRKNFISIEK